MRVVATAEEASVGSKAATTAVAGSSARERAPTQ